MRSAIKTASIVAALSFLFFGCKKDTANNVLSKLSSNKTTNCKVINELGTGKNMSYMELLADFQKPYDAVVHIQSQRNVGYQQLGGLPFLSISASLPAYKKENKQISLKINERVFETKGYALLYGIEKGDKESFQNFYGNENHFVLTNEKGKIAEFSASLPKHPELSLKDYKPGIGMSLAPNSDLNVSWIPDATNKLDGLLVTLSVPVEVGGDNNRTIYIIVPDNGTYTISNTNLKDFLKVGSVEVSLSRGAYQRVELAEGKTKSLCYYAILETHFRVNFEN